jgi:hypothetical protein
MEGADRGDPVTNFLSPGDVRRERQQSRYLPLLVISERSGAYWVALAIMLRKTLIWLAFL